jgi:acyl dehydratase
MLIVTALAVFYDKREELLARNRETLIFQPLHDPARTQMSSDSGALVHLPPAGTSWEPKTPAPACATELHIGQQVPVLQREINLVRMIAYAGATWDWARLHYDSAYVAERNLPAPVIDGQMLGALLSEALLDWLGPRAFITTLNFRLRAMAFAGDMLRCGGEVTALVSQGQHPLVSVAQRVCIGSRVIATGSADIRLPA